MDLQLRKYRATNCYNLLVTHFYNKQCCLAYSTPLLCMNFYDHMESSLCAFHGRNDNFHEFKLYSDMSHTVDREFFTGCLGGEN